MSLKNNKIFLEGRGEVEEEGGKEKCHSTENLINLIG